jgi:hypothetical protein
MKILITGATGFIGKTLIPYLFEHDMNSITLLVRNHKKAITLFPTLIENIITLENSDWREQIIAYNPDIVLHMATCFTTKSDTENAKKIIEANITFTTLLLESLVYTQCKYFINIGTFSEYSYGENKYNPNNLYSASKTAARSIIQYYQKESKWKWLNIVMYSPYGRYNNSHKKIIDYMLEALYSPIPINFSKGEQILDFIHVDDIANFLYIIILKINLFTEMYTQLHCGTGQGHSLREVGSMIEDIFGKKLNADWGHLTYRPLDIMYAVAPIAKNIDFLNWRAQITLEKGINILKQDIEAHNDSAF